MSNTDLFLPIVVIGPEDVIMMNDHYSYHLLPPQSLP
jgi:hypothetical protein